MRLRIIFLKKTIRIEKVVYKINEIKLNKKLPLSTLTFINRLVYFPLD